MKHKILSLFLVSFWFCCSQAVFNCIFSNRQSNGCSSNDPSKKIATQFFLFTPTSSASHGKKIPVENLDAFKSSSFDKNLTLAIIVHGFQQNAGVHWVEEMRGELMKRPQRMNIIALNWGTAASAINYVEAACNTRLVGAHLAEMAMALKDHFQYDLSRIHVIGHSLGAHVAGFAGQRLGLRNETLGRITGLDPAQPCFDTENPDVRLDPSDAEFVDVIHTDTGNLLGGSLGLERQSGHVDFYPNGGASQPGCTKGDSSGKTSSVQHESFADMFVCDHMIALKYFTASINSPPDCSRKAYPCESWDTFKTGKCFDCHGACAQMGYHADQYRVNGSHKYYLFTSNNAPYCAPQSYITVTLHSLRERNNIFDFFTSLMQSSKEIKIEFLIGKTGQPGLTGQTITSATTKVKDSSRMTSLVIGDVDPAGPLKIISLLYSGPLLYIGKVTVKQSVSGKTYTARYNKWVRGPSFFGSFSRYYRCLQAEGDSDCRP